MKTKQLLLSFISTLVIGGAVILFLNDAEKQNAHDKTYQPREKSDLNADNYGARGAAEWISKRRVNPATGTISEADYALAQKTYNASLEASQKRASEEEKNWEFIGPDNVGGRTRAFLVDNKDKKTLWAGGVAGGLWKSTSNGQNWIPVYVKDLGNLFISSICQDKDGTIYFGTGEYFAGLNAVNSTSTGFEGNGIWKTSDGVNFEHLTATANNTDFRTVNELIYDKKSNALYAATNYSVMKSADGGATWNTAFVKNGTSTALNGNMKDITSTSEGVIVFTRYYLDNSEVYTCTDATNAVKRSGFDSNINRIEFAVAPSDPNYIYALCAYRDYSSHKYFNLYRSTDAGETWTSLVTNHTPSVSVFGSNNQGYYDNTIAVYPDDKDKVILGGVDLWSWSAANKFEQISYWLEYAGTKYVHADQHAIVFHPDYATNKTVYFTNDGGIFSSSNGGVAFTALNKNYGVTQYYGIDCGPKGQIIGGCQDNGSPYMDMEQKTDLKSSFEVTGGDGGYSEASELYPGAIYTTIYNSALIRSNESGKKATLQRNPFDSNTKSNLKPGQKGSGNPFVTPIDMFESFNDEKSKIFIPFVVDTVFKLKPSGFMDTIVEFPEGYIFFVESSVVEHKKFEYKLTAEDIARDKNGKIEPGDTIAVREKFSNLMAIGGYKKIYFTREMLNFKDETPNWETVLGIDKKGTAINAGLGVGTAVSYLKWSGDGDALYAVANYGNVYRFTNFNKAYAFGKDEKRWVYDKREIAEISLTDQTGQKITKFEAGKVQYKKEDGTVVTLENISQIDTVAKYYKLELTEKDFLACDPATETILSTSITGNETVNQDYVTYEFDTLSAGHVTYVYQMDTTTKTTYDLAFTAYTLSDCASMSLPNVNTSTVASIEAMPIPVDYDSVKIATDTYKNIFHIDTVQFTPDTLLNLVRRNLEVASCTIDTIKDLNKNDILSKTAYVHNYDAWKVTFNSGDVSENILKIDSTEVIEQFVDVTYKDTLGGSCTIKNITNLNVAEISNFETKTTNVPYTKITTAAATYNKVTKIDTVMSLFTYNFTGADTTYTMGELGDDMVWRHRHVNTVKQVKAKEIFSGVGSVTSIATDPNNPNKLIVTVGGYGSHDKIFYTANALDETPSFVSVTGNLPAVPVYSSLIADDKGYIFVGTEKGVYSTQTLGGSSTEWHKEANIPDVPVFELVQQTKPNGYVAGVGPMGVENSGMVYAGTHGLGVWRMDNLKRPFDNIPSRPNQPVAQLQVKVYPNPAVESTKVEFTVNKRTDVKIEVYSVSGQLVYQDVLNNQEEGTFTSTIPVANLENGIYIVNVEMNGKNRTAKFVKQ